MPEHTEHRIDATGARHRVRRLYVDVLARIGRDGGLDSVAVLWPDGSRFVVDKVLAAI